MRADESWLDNYSNFFDHFYLGVVFYGDEKFHKCDQAIRSVVYPTTRID